MTPALEPGDHLIAVRRYGVPQRGQIVIFHHEEHTYVKRVVAIGSDTVSVEDGRVLINGEPEPWGVGRVAYQAPIVVPADHWWVLGDRRELSTTDSRTFGSISPDVWWVAYGRYRPIRRAGLLHRVKLASGARRMP